ncbi:MAG: DNA mismatch repair endonuclease MutL [Nitrospirae bacterium]|nr:DNA mismatch repair endonuclease MutL [Nitrospirota bacterium]
MSLVGVGKIHVLPGEVISRIAAGEVVERPAAVVKELIDNSLDAGSTRITIEVTDGGRGLIRVTDDGEGMSRTDAPLAFQRHATSKLRTERDLWSIRTLGFRGEALPSIASVSKVRLVTACRGESVGTQMLLTGGAVHKIEETAAAPGTLVEVTALFFNTPARKKFLKATATEFSHICQVVQHAALAWPRTQFRLKHNGQEVLDYPAVSSRRDRILQVYGVRLLEQMLEVRGERAGIRLEGFTVDPAQTRAGRAPQDLFVNSRPIRNATIAHAIYDGYGTFLAKGRYPLFVLCLEVDPERVDVNVHPMKREVRFADQDMIHKTVRQAIREAVGGGHHETVVSSLSSTAGPQGATAWRFSLGAEAGRSPADGDLSGGDFVSSGRSSAPMVGESSPSYLIAPGCDVTPLGQVGQTFLVAQVGSELQVIDQHTAHERVLFERLCRAWTGQTVESQPLLIPEPIDLPPHAAALLQRHLADLEMLGVKIEPFGSHSFVIRAVPALLGHLDYPSLLQDFVEELAQWNSAASLEARVRPVLASLACHGAVRAGRPMKLSEIKKLIEEWVGEGLPATCPHGRRIALRLPAEELAKIFGRM